MVTPVPDRFDFPGEEEKVLKLWKKIDAFRESLKQSKDRPKYTFYDGPPFATGLPHYGHILAGTIKVSVLMHSPTSWCCGGFIASTIPIPFTLLFNNA